MTKMSVSHYGMRRVISPLPSRKTKASGQVTSWLRIWLMARWMIRNSILDSLIVPAHTFPLKGRGMFEIHSTQIGRLLNKY